MPHPLQGFGRLRQAIGHGRSQLLHFACREQPTVFPLPNQLGYAGHIGSQYRPTQGHGLHDDHRQPFGETRQHQCAGGQDFFTYLGAADPASDAHLCLQAMAGDQRVDLLTHFTIAGQHQFKRYALGQQDPGCFEQ
ncbi:hypothetical protein D3C79_919680 [compost metagenome]